MNIAVNTRFLLGHKMEGFGWFTFEIVKRMVLAHPEHTFYFLFDRSYDQRFVFSENVKPIVLRPQARHPVLFKIWFDFSVTRALKKYKIDLFFSPDGYLSLKTNVKQVGVIHDLNFEHYPQDLPKVASRYLKHYFPLFAQKADHIITVSQYSKQDIVKLYGVPADKITVSHNAASSHFKVATVEEKSQVRAKYTDGKPFFVYVGAIHARKNIPRLIQAFIQFKKETASPTKLVIVGTDLFANASGRDQMEGHPDIVFTGHVGIEILAKIVGAAQALCLVSYFEGFGIPLVEAMQSGVPVLAAEATALPEVAGDAGILVNPFSVEAIQDGLTELDGNTDLRLKLSEHALKRAKAFSWDKSADIIWQEINLLLGK